MPLKFDEQKCPQNHHCPLIEGCPVGAISQVDDHSLPSYDPQTCIKCGSCVDMCRMGAVTVVAKQ